MSEPLHPTDALQDALDGRLDAEARAALDAHLATCAQCRRELDALGWTKAQLAAASRVQDVPEDLDAQIRRALDVEDRAARSQGSTGGGTDRRAPRVSRWIGWAAAAAAIVVVIWIGGRRIVGETPPEEASAMFRAFVTGSLPLGIETADPKALEAQLNTAGLGFQARVFDFGMMNYRLAGGGVHRLAGRRSALFAYRGPDARALVCQMYEGSVQDLPAPTQRRVNDGIEFSVYREGELTIVFWQEGQIVCVLVADGDPEAAVKLAFAKAVRI